MSVVLRTNQITGVSVVVNATDGASKEYADNASSGGTPSITGNENEFLTTDGSTTSWQPIQGYQEYTTAGNYTFNVPTHATELFIEATGAGGGGGSGLATTSTTYVNRGEFWFLRTSGTAFALGASINGIGPCSIYDGTNYIFANQVTVSSTDTITWTLRTTRAGTVYGVAYGSDQTEKYVIAGTSGIVNSSTDSIVWTLRTAGFGTSSINTASYGNGFYFIGDQNSSSVRVSTDAITWQFRTTVAVLQVYHSVYGGGYYVVGGSTDHVRSSTDTIVWILRTTAFSKSGFINCMTYGNGIFVSGNSNGAVCTSTDSINWVARTSGFGSSVLYSLHYGFHNNNHLYVLGISAGPTRVSTDGIVWILRTVGINATGSSVYGNGIHVKSGNSGQMSVSPLPSGNAGSGGGSGTSLGSIISKSNISSSTLTVNVGSGGTAGTAGAASTVSWTSPGGNFSITANGGSAGVNTFPSTSNILSGGSGGTVSSVSNNYVYSSPGTVGGNGGYFESTTIGIPGIIGSDATSATLPYQTTGGGGGASSLFHGDFGTFSGTINYYNNTYQNSKTISASINGTSSLPIGGLSYGNGGNGGGAQHGAVAWVLRTSGFGATAYGIGGGNGVYVIVGASGNLRTSTDTITWTLRTSGFGTSSINEIISDGTNLVAVSNGGAIRASTNGIQWSIRTSPTTNNLGNPGNTGPAGIYVNNLYLVGGTSGAYVVSTDSIVWTLRTSGLGSNTVWSVAYGSALTEKYLISAGGILASSTDNISWTLRTSGTGALNSLNYLNSNYYAFNNSNVIRTSTNGIQWSTQVTVAHALYSSAVSNNSLITGGATGSAYSSTNGIAWVLRTSNVGSVNAFAFGYGNGLFLATYGSSAQVIVADSNINGGNGGAGTRGGGGGGGAYSLATNTAGTGGTGGDGYVRISWQ